MRYHIIFNPTAQNGKSREILEQITACLEEAGVEYEVHETLYVGHAEEIAREYSVENRDIIVVGGDGTFHEVLNGLENPQETRLTLVPAGTGNDFATALKIPFDPEKIVALTLKGNPKETDYMEAMNRRCLNVGGLGMDVDVLERVSRGRMKGKVKYLFSLLSSMFAFKGYRMRVSVNGKVLDKNALFAAVCNGSLFGGGICICPGAQADDGKLELVLVEQMNFFGIIRAFISLMCGKILRFKKTTHLYCESVTILPESAKTVQLDGELYEGRRTLDFNIKRGLKIYR